MFTPKVAGEEESDDVDHGIQSYSGVLAEMGTHRVTATTTQQETAPRTTTLKYVSLTLGRNYALSSVSLDGPVLAQGGPTTWKCAG